MTVPQIKVKIHRRPQIKLKVLPRFPANVIGEGGIDVELVGGNLVISPDLGVLGDVTGPGAGASVAGELAVFTDGNNIEGSGIQYTDFVDATAIREKLADNTTFWVRSDGNNGNTGLSNAAGAAFLTWNALYLYVAQNYDFNGYTVTLKSGTTNVYAGGLFMNTSWVGGGGLIIDGNGCGIAETTTKAIINNVDQPGPIYIQNFAAGIATTLGSGVQNSAPSNLYILEGNVFGTCQNAHIEAIQGGNIFCHYDYDLTGTGAARHAYAALGSTLVLFAEARLLSNQTFSDGFVYIEEGANLQAAGFSCDLNGFTVTCPRFVAKAGRINTGGGGENFFPGTSKGVRSQGGIYDGSSGVETIYGGSAAGSGLTLVGTSNASPLLDFVNLYAGTINIGSPTAPTAISFGSPGVPFATVYYSGSTSGFTALKASAVASGTMTIPAGTGTLLYGGGPGGTPSSITLTNGTGLPISTGLSGAGTGVLAALAVNIGSAGAPVLFNGAGGTPSAVTLTNGTGLPVSTGISGLAAGVATFLGTANSTNLIAALTDEVSALGVTPRALFGTAGNLPASATNDSAQAGNLGEYVAASATFGSATVTMTIASPSVVTWSGIPYAGAGNWTAPIKFTTSGALPTGVVSGTQYWIIGSTVSGNTFQIATSIANALAGTAINTSGSQSGTHTGNSTLSLTTDTPADIAAISLTAGDWDVWGSTGYNPNGATTSSYYAAWTSATAATLPTPPNAGGYSDSRAAFSAGNAAVTSAGRRRFSLSSTTTIYLGTYASFAVNTNAAAAFFIGARRVR